MLYGITSKRKGCGRSLIALLSAMTTQSQTKGSTLLVDLGSGNDFRSLLKIEKTNASIDNLISAISLELEDLNIPNNLVEVNGIHLLPGTSVRQSRYLEKRCNDIVYLLKHLETMFNTIILDIDYSLFEDLVDSGLDITPIHILEQNILSIEGYHESMRTQIFDGFYVLNRYDSSIYPELNLFTDNFKKNSVICVGNDTNLTTSFNKKKLTLAGIKKSPTYPGILKISTIIAKDINVIESSYGTKPRGFFKRMFNIDGGSVNEVNSLDWLSTNSQGNKSKGKVKKTAKTAKSNKKVVGRVKGE